MNGRSTEEKTHRHTMSMSCSLSGSSFIRSNSVFFFSLLSSREEEERKERSMDK